MYIRSLKSNIMQRLFITALACLFSFSMIGQQRIPDDELLEKSTKEWVFNLGGNPIDGFTRTAFRTVIPNDNDVFMIKVTSTAETNKIEDASIGEGNNRDDIMVDIKTNGSFQGLKKVLVYFNNETPFYEVNYKSYGDGSFLWWSAMDENQSVYLSRFDFIHKLKIKSKVTFRFEYENSENKDISISLNGSTKAINQVVDLSNIIPNKGDEYTWEVIRGSLILFSLLEDESLITDLTDDYDIKIDDFRIKITPYLIENVGEYCFALIGSYSYSDYNINVYDLNQEVIISVSLSDILQD